MCICAVRTVGIARLEILSNTYQKRKGKCQKRRYKSSLNSFLFKNLNVIQFLINLRVVNGFLRLRCWRNGLPFRTRRHFGLSSTRAHLFAQVTLKNALISLAYDSHMIPAVIFIKTTATCTLFSRFLKILYLYSYTCLSYYLSAFYFTPIRAWV